MQIENANIEYKSLKKAIGNKANIKELAETCVCLANAQGGLLYIGVEDKTKEPPVNQTISDTIVNDILAKLRAHTDSVGIADPQVITHQNSGQYFTVTILPTSRTIATTTSGKIFLRVGDKCFPISGEEVTRLAAEKNAFQWELVEVKSATLSKINQQSIQSFCNSIRASKRIKDSVRQKDDIEILLHYQLIDDNLNHLTNLGVLWIGTPQMRSRLAYPITVQYIVYDDRGEKIRKENWYDNDLNPFELITIIEQQATELKYFYEFPQGLFRKRINQYAPEVIRELLINAIAHKKFTISGDIFIEVHPNYLEITNPGNLPIGISKDNILHSRHRRNPYLIRILHDLGLMEGEGSGFDLIYEIDSKDNKPFPVVQSEFDFTKVIQSSEILDEDSVYLLEYISNHYSLTQKEFIALGMLIREKKMLGTELSKSLQLSEEDRLRSYVSNLVNEGVLITRGQRKGTSYLINPELIKSSESNVKPSLKTIEIHSLKALIEQDLQLHPNSKIGEIDSRIPDVSIKDIRKAVYDMVEEEKLEHTGAKKNRTYFLVKKK